MPGHGRAGSGWGGRRFQGGPAGLRCAAAQATSSAQDSAVRASVAAAVTPASRRPPLAGAARAAVVVQRAQRDEQPEPEEPRLVEQEVPAGLRAFWSRRRPAVEVELDDAEQVQRLGHVGRQRVRGRVGRPGQRRDDDQPPGGSRRPQGRRGRARPRRPARMNGAREQAGAAHGGGVLEGARPGRASLRGPGSRGRRPRRRPPTRRRRRAPRPGSAPRACGRRWPGRRW